jgi:hypothetical protein
MKRKHQCILNETIPVAALLIALLSGCGEKDRFIERSWNVINEQCGGGQDFFLFEPNVYGKNPLTLVIHNDGKCTIRVVISQPANGTPVERLSVPAGTTKSYTIAILDTAQMKFRWECKSGEDATLWCHGTVELYQLFQGSTKNFVNATFVDSLDVAGSGDVTHTSPNSCFYQKIFVDHKNGSNDPQRLHLSLSNTWNCPVRLWNVLLPPQGKSYDTTLVTAGKSLDRYFTVPAGTTVIFFAECFDASMPVDSVYMCGWRGRAVLFAE